MTKIKVDGQQWRWNTLKSPREAPIGKPLMTSDGGGGGKLHLKSILRFQYHELVGKNVSGNGSNVKV